MPKRDRDPLDVTRGPSRGSICPDCGYERAAVTTPATAKLDAAKHADRHARWDLDGGRPTVWTRTTIASHLFLVDHLNARIVGLEQSVTAYEWDVKVLTELVDDLKADLAAIEEGRH